MISCSAQPWKKTSPLDRSTLAIVRADALAIVDETLSLLNLSALKDRVYSSLVWRSETACGSGDRLGHEAGNSAAG